MAQTPRWKDNLKKIEMLELRLEDKSDMLSEARMFEIAALRQELDSLKVAVLTLAENQLDVISKLKGRNSQFMKVGKWSGKQRRLEDIIDKLGVSDEAGS